MSKYKFIVENNLDYSRTLYYAGGKGLLTYVKVWKPSDVVTEEMIQTAIRDFLTKTALGEPEYEVSVE